MICNCFMSEVAGRDDVRKRGAAFPAHPKTFCQVDLDEIAILSAQLTERIQGLHNSCATGPPCAQTSRQRHHCNASQGESLKASGTMAIINRIRGEILNEARSGQTVLRQTDPARTKILANLLMLHAVEPVVIEQSAEGSRSASFSFLTGG